MNTYFDLNENPSAVRRAIIHLDHWDVDGLYECRVFLNGFDLGLLTGLENVTRYRWLSQAIDVDPQLLYLNNNKLTITSGPRPGYDPNNHDDFEFTNLYFAALTDNSIVYQDVEIDIKPGSHPNSINLKSKGKVPVAILTTDDFNAYDVDPVSCEFAGANPMRWNMEDVDNDGDYDMLFHFMTQELDLTKESTEATLEGETIYGFQITGTDSVNIVPKGKGYSKEGKKKKKK